MSKKYEITTVINLMGGPSSGKSVMASEIFASLKRLGIDAELASEYAKDKVWEGSIQVMENQIYMFAKQHHRLFRLKGKVQVIVTDSPILLCTAYDNTQDPNYKALIVSQFNRYNNLNVFIERSDNYNENGRMQTLAQAKEKDQLILDCLIENNIPFIRVPDSKDSVTTVLNALKADNNFTW